LLGTFGAMTVSVPEHGSTDSDGKQAEWRSKALPAYKRLTVQAERLIVGAYLAGTNTRRSGAPWPRCSAGRLARTP